MHEICIILFGVLNVVILFYVREKFKNFEDVWLVPLIILFIYFFLNVFLHESVDLLNSFGTPEYRKYLSDTLVEPMIVVWSVILGAVFFSKRHDERKNQYSYNVKIIEKKQ
ncbi:hypothetical protein [Halomonas halodenitrificans]|uniref:hypothetical protein n=1 Tax=Halomonas halodenitrificans TaxID=28252 RepID=UPI0012EC6084|nr:hypothetical protein [Halomonas halodenitrificans]